MLSSIIKWQIGVAVFTILLFLYAFATVCSIMSSWWLAKWTEYPAYPAVGRWGARKVEFCKNLQMYYVTKQQLYGSMLDGC